MIHLGSSAKYAILLLLLVCMLFLSLLAGSVRFSLKETVAAFSRAGNSSPTSRIIILDLRLSRSVLAAVVGAALAISGAAFQGLFRNPLADPFVIGASSGAALGASLAIAFNISVFFGSLSTVPVAAFVGSLLSVFVVFGISSVGSRRPPTVTLLLAGTALSALLSSLVSFIMAVRDDELHQIFFWLLGGFGGTNWKHLTIILPYVLPGAAALLLLARPLDVLGFGEESAQTLGINISRMRMLTVMAASLTTAAAVAVSGIIGFVGLLAPHAARLMFGPSHRTMMPAAALVGAVILTGADILARIVLAPVELPVGVLTSMLGAPFFLYLLRRRHRWEPG